MGVVSGTGGRVLGLLALLLLLAAGAEFVVRGPLRAVKGSDDFTVFFAASRAFRHHGNPYDQNLVEAEFAAAQENPTELRRQVRTVLVPPHTLVPLLPFSFLTWQQARIVFACLNCVLPVLALALFLWRHRAVDHAPFRSYLCVLLFLAMAPLHTGIALGQTTPCAIACILGSLEVAEAKRPWAAGVLLALAIMLKPTVAVLFVAYFVLQRGWRQLAVCGAILLAVTLGVALWWGGSTFDYLASEAANVQQVRSGGALSPTGSLYWQQIDLAPLSVLPWGYVPLLGLVVGMILALVLAFALFRMRNRPDDPEAHALALAGLCLLTVMICYHRYYDLFLLMIGAAYAIFAVPFTRRQIVFLLIVSPACLFPISAALVTLQGSVSWIGTVISLPVVGRLLLLHVNIIILLLFCWTLWRMRLAAGPDAEGCGNTPSEVKP